MIYNLRNYCQASFYVVITRHDTDQMKAGFTFRRIRPELTSGQLTGWRTCIPVSGVLLPQSRQVISLGDKYFLSMGAHIRKTHLLMDLNGKEPLTVEKSFAATALLTFVTDSPVVPDHTGKPTKYAPSNLSQFQRDITRAGIRSHDYFYALMSTAETLDVLAEVGGQRAAMFERKIPSGRVGTCPYIYWPGSAGTWRALTAYWSAILSAVIPGRILNFWRAIEAVTTKTQRYAMFADLEHSRVKPVWTKILMPGKPGIAAYIRVRNSAALLKQRALGRRNRLIALYGSASAALDWLFWERRGKAAHADQSSLDFEGLSSFNDQISDALLFRYMARVAIEGKWS